MAQAEDPQAPRVGRSLVLLSILQQDIPPHYVHQLVCDESIEWMTDGRSNRWVSLHEDRGPPFVSSKDRALLREFIAGIHYVDTAEKERLHSTVCDSNESAALILLLCALPELRFVDLPVDWDDWMDRILYGIAKDCESHKRPMQKLLIVSTLPINVEWGTGIEKLYPWLAMPSIQRIVAACCRSTDLEYEYPSDFPPCRVPEIYFDESSLSARTVQAFAKCLSAPCMIRQFWFDASETADYGGVAWDHFEVSGDVNDVTGLIKPETRRERLENRYHQDIEPGYSLPSRPLSALSDGMNENHCWYNPQWEVEGTIARTPTCKSRAMNSSGWF